MDTATALVAHLPGGGVRRLSQTEKPMEGHGPGRQGGMGGVQQHAGPGRPGGGLGRSRRVKRLGGYNTDLSSIPIRHCA